MKGVTIGLGYICKPILPLIAQIEGRVMEVYINNNSEVYNKISKITICLDRKCSKI